MFKTVNNKFQDLKSSFKVNRAYKKTILNIRQNRINYMAEQTGLHFSYFDSLSDKDLFSALTKLALHLAEEEEKKKQVQILKISDDMYNYYKKHVKGNKDTTREQAELKMTRNMLLALPVKLKNNKMLYKYGALHFTVKNGKIDWIKNNCTKPKVWYMDNKLYKEISKQFGIID